jgi:hypothetical protein
VAGLESLGNVVPLSVHLRNCGWRLRGRFPRAGLHSIQPNFNVSSGKRAQAATAFLQVGKYTKQSTRSSPSHEPDPSQRDSWPSFPTGSTGCVGRIYETFLSSGEPQTAELGGGRGSGDAASAMPGGPTADFISFDPLESES